MSTLLEIAVSNLLMAAALAVPALLAGWWGRRPALTHGLWLLVLLKLVTPPIGRVPVAVLGPGSLPEEPAVVGQAFLPAEPWQAEMRGPQTPAEPAVVPEVVLPDRLPDVTPLPDGPPVAQVPVPLDPDAEPPAHEEIAAATVPDWSFIIGVTWLTGSGIWLLLALRRLMHFGRLLRFAEPAPAALQGEARTLAAAMGVRCPRVLVLPGTISPMLWAMGGRPRILLPVGLVGRLRPAQQATLLAHELAHWRRGDHRIRLLEVLALALYWWCPFVWWARRQLQQAEEECCDAWVVALLPAASRDYALTLVETIDFLSGAPQTLPPVASGVGHVRLLQRRLTMILRGATPQSLTRRGLVLLAGIGLVLLPFIPTLAQQPGGGQPERQQAADFLRALSHKQAEEENARALLRIAELAQAGQLPLDQAQRELDERRAHLQKQLEQLHQAVEQLKQAAKAAANQQPAGPAGGRDLPKIAGGGMGGAKGGGMGGMAGGRGGMGGMAGGMAGGMGGMQGMMGPGGMAGATARGGNVEQRLEQVERKLDILLWEIANLRRDMSKGPAAMGQSSGPGGMVPPGMSGSGFGGGRSGRPQQGSPAGK